ncbi:sugar ABC transporter permease [Clostridium chromiireducens]|uniref:Maltose transport system permease protein MalG n=1 Tax=Clostridium chromiireducens TaxID=225345 RepID=A0A1V4J160_9CLOT|nr:sugar ABC transporter permease [Clostridium chromiireducens]OPJ65916.1 maltose transport system permease protein MalG [Clostridium chromiireducens]
MVSVENQKVEVLKYKKRIRPAQMRAAWASRVVIWFMCIIVLIPLLAVITASLAKGQGFTQSSIFPKSITLENYIKVLTKTQFLVWVKNSIFLCTTVAVIQILLTMPAAFAFSKIKFKGRKYGLMSLLLLQMFPTTMALPAILGVAYKYNMMDKLWALVLLLAGGSAYNIWLMKGYMDSIPKELTESAYIDGASTFQAFIKIIIPLIRNMIVVIFIFAFIGTYSEFYFTSALIKAKDAQTVVTGMRDFIRDQYAANWTQFSAAAVMSTIPIVAIFVATQKFLAKGLTAGSVKG